MDKKLEKKIISLYKKGNSSLEIVKITGVQKYKILKVLNEHNLVRKRDRCSKLDIKKEGDNFYISRTCPGCNKEIKTVSKTKCIACRNYYNRLKGTSLCKPCSLKLQVGEGNPFYGKKHTKETKKKISKSRVGKATGNKNSMAKKENRDKIGKKLKERIKLNPIKYNVVSKSELRILKLISNYYPDVIGSYHVDRYICDIFIPSLNLIIEFYGDYWHCNPNRYDEKYYHTIKKKTSKQIWEEDKVRVDIIKNYGYNLEVIWEFDSKNPNNIKNILEKYEKN